MDEQANKKDETSSSDTIEISPGKHISKLRQNPWIIATFVFAILFLVVLVLDSSGSTTARVSQETAGENVLNFLSSNPEVQGELSVVSAQEQGSFYEVMLNYQGQQIPIYVTTDGKYMLSGEPILLSEGFEATTNEATNNQPQEPAPQNIQKTDKPKVELFVMSYCPFGTQFEKGILPVLSTLKNKIDFELKFVNYAMHGKKEMDENVLQYCLQEEQNEKFLPYLQCFLEAGDSANCLTQKGIDKTKLNSCMENANTEFHITEDFENQATWLSGRYPKFRIHETENQQYGVQGSPTLIINGVEANSARDSASLLRTICGAFNSSPEECNEDLSSFGNPAPGFGFDTTGATASAADCGF